MLYSPADLAHELKIDRRDVYHYWLHGSAIAKLFTRQKIKAFSQDRRRLLLEMQGRRQTDRS
jgi:hypothetical protein